MRNNININNFNTSSNSVSCSGGNYLFVRVILKGIITAIFMLTGISAYSQQYSWSKYSSFPEGGTVIDIAGDNSGKIYVLNQFSQVFYSTNNGANWVVIPETYSWWNAIDIEVDKVTGMLYVGTSTEGIWYTSDLGITWNNEYFYTTSQGQHALIAQVGAKHGSNIAVAIEPDFGAANTYVTTNNGASWTQHLNNATYNTATDLLFLQNGTLLAASTNGVHQSNNNGATWFNNGTNLSNKIVTSLSQRTSGNVFAGVNYNYVTSDTTASGVYLSTNNGQSWILASSGITDRRISGLYFDDVTSTLFATTPSGVFSSSNNGSSWSQINFNLVDKSINCVTGKTTGEIFIGANQDGVSLLGTNTWTLRNHGLFNTAITSMVMDNPTTFYLSCYGSSGLYKTNTSNQWQHPGIGQLPSRTCNKIAKNNNGDLYATFLSLNISDGVVTSTDSGATWSNLGTTIPVPSGINYASFDDIEFGPLAGQIYVLARYSGYPITTFQEVFRTLDNGLTWTSIFSSDTSNSIYPINDLDITASGDIYITYTESSTIKVMFSNNQGATFNLLNTNVSGTIQDIAIDKQDSIYLIADNVVYEKNGSNWNIKPNGGWQLNSSQHDVSIYFDNVNSIYLSCADDGVYYSNTNGMSWQNISTGIPSYVFASVTYKVYFKDFYFDSANKPFARSTAIGVNDMAPQGIFTFDTVSTTSISEVSDGKTISLFPNPSHDKIFLSQNIGSECFITDLLGKEIIRQKLNNRNELNIQDLDAGIYFLRTDKNIALKFIKN